MRVRAITPATAQTGAFIPEYAGKLDFYLSVVDGIMKTDRDDPTIGLLHCESHNGAVIEFSFKRSSKADRRVYLYRHTGDAEGIGTGGSVD